MNIQDLLNCIKLTQNSVDALNDKLMEETKILRNLKSQLKKICDHPDDVVVMKSQGLQDDYGSYSGTEYWYTCTQCECESKKDDWDHDRGQYRLGSRRGVAGKYYTEFTNRPLPSKQRPLL